MTRLGWLVAGTLVLICACIAALFVWHQHATKPVAVLQTEATSTPAVDPSELAIYTSGVYGFSFFYPANGTVSDSFTATTTSNLPWRQGATGAGTSIVRISTSAGEVRVGVSSAAAEVGACLKAGPAEKALGTRTVGSTTWNHFSFQKIGTDNEQSVDSYRAVHASQCFALETLMPLASGATSSPSFSLADAVESFTFAH